jgi:hypothetical protein
MMLDTARAAEQSDPIRNVFFVRRWTGPPPRNRKGLGRDTQAYFENLNLNQPHHTIAELAAQRACRSAACRLASLQRRAAIADALGLVDAADRFRSIGATIREALA